LVEFEILQEDPVIVYGLIQGSASEPYTVIIDMSEPAIYHSCPDFNKGRGYCKHIGKILLKLQPASINKIATNRQSISVNRSIQAAATKLAKLKENIILESKEIGDIPLTEMIETVGRTLNSGGNADDALINIIQLLKNELDQSTHILTIMKLDSVVQAIQRSGSTSLLSKVEDILKQKFEDVMSNFLDSFWTTSTLRRLEQAYLLNRIAVGLRKCIELQPLELPSDISQAERIDARIVLGCLLNKSIESAELLHVLGHQYDSFIIDDRFKLLSGKIEISGTSVPDVKRYVKSASSSIERWSRDTSYIDDLLIYIIKANGERPIMKVDLSKYYSFVNLPTTIIEQHPSLNYVIEHIKTSGREYITKDELHGHKRLFQWLNGEDVSHRWAERPRNRQPDSSLNPQGLIIQWDVCVNGQYPEFLNAYRNNTRITIDKSSHLFSQVQPFDITLCHPEAKPGQEWSEIVSPTAILLPDQVVNLVLQGTEIVSNILPWDCLARFAQSGYIESGEISVAVDQCKKHRFAYGSVVLEKALTEISKLGRSGLSEESYQKIHEQLRISSGKMNSQTRPLAKQLVIGEGETLQSLVANYGKDEKHWLGVVIKAGKGSPTLEIFRETLVKTLVEDAFKRKKISQKFLSSLTSLDFGPYAVVGARIRQKFLTAFNELKQVLVLTTPPTKARVGTNYIGDLVLSDLKLSKYGRFSEEEFQAVQLRIKSISDHF